MEIMRTKCANNLGDYFFQKEIFEFLQSKNSGT